MTRTAPRPPSNSIPTVRPDSSQFPQPGDSITVFETHEQTEPTATDRGPATDRPGIVSSRRALLAFGFVIYPFVTAIGVSQFSNGLWAVAGYAIAVAFCCVLALAIVALVRQATPRFWLLLGAMALLFVAELPIARADAFFLCAVVVALTVGRLQRRAAPLVAASVLACFFVPWAVPSWHSGPGWVEALMMISTVVPAYVVSQIVSVNRELIEARAEIAHLASEAERARIARDLHDLLGHSLTAITVKAGLARRLAASDSSASLREIAAVEELARHALADVRAAVSSYREVTVAGELARGKELLRAAGITADLPTATDIVDATHQELFGWAVREGLTNVVRHSRALNCTVTLSRTEVEIRDDGIGGQHAPGNGLAGLRERVATAGGHLEAGPLDPRGWRLLVTVGPDTVA